MTMFIHSTDGIKADGGLSFKDHSGEGCWFPVVWRNPECAEGEIVLTTGYFRVDDHFEPIFVHHKQEKGEPMKYSARSILRELRELGEYEAFRQLLTSIGYDWEFLSANYLAENDADFKRLKAAVVEAGVVSSMTELDAMLAKCIWTAE